MTAQCAIGIPHPHPLINPATTAISSTQTQLSNSFFIFKGSFRSGD
jgi:hypothetical protein